MASVASVDPRSGQRLSAYPELLAGSPILENTCQAKDRHPYLSPLSPPCPPLVQTILDNSPSPYAQLLAASSLIKIVSEHSLGPQVKLEMRSYFLNYLDRLVSGWVLSV